MTSICTKYLLRRQVLAEGNILETLKLRKFERPDARVQTTCSETQSPVKVQTEQQTLKSESKILEEVRTAQQTRANESILLQESSDVDAMTADNESSLCNRPNARVAGPDVPHANLSLSRIRISEAYIIRPLGSVFLRSII